MSIHTRVSDMDQILLKHICRTGFWPFVDPPSHLSLCRGLGLTIAGVLLLAFVERPSSLSVSSDPRHRSPPWEPPCGFTESIEMVCLIIFALDLTVKVSRARVEIFCYQDTGSCLVKHTYDVSKVIIWL